MHLSARQFHARHFTARHLQLTAGSVAAAPDVYAWFPGDPGGGGMRRYEEYATEPRKRRRGPQRIPRALLESLQAAQVDVPPPLHIPAPIAPVTPLELPPPAAAPSKHPEGAKKVLPEVYPVPTAAVPAAGADWTAYAHLPPLSPEEDAEELMVLAQFTRRNRR